MQVNKNRLPCNLYKKKDIYKSLNRHQILAVSGQPPLICYSENLTNRGQDILCTL